MIQRHTVLLLYVSELTDELNEPLGPVSTNCPSHVAMETRVMISSGRCILVTADRKACLIGLVMTDQYQSADHSEWHLHRRHLDSHRLRHRTDQLEHMLVDQHRIPDEEGMSLWR